MKETLEIFITFPITVEYHDRNILWVPITVKDMILSRCGTAWKNIRSFFFSFCCIRNDDEGIKVQVKVNYEISHYNCNHTDITSCLYKAKGKFWG